MGDKEIGRIFSLTGYTHHSRSLWKTFQYPSDLAEGKCANRHEHVRKDIERAFGVLVSKFGILERTLCGWYLQDLRSLIDCCIFIHNMVIKERCAGFRLNDLNRNLNKEYHGNNSDNDEANVDTMLPKDEVEIQLQEDIRQVLDDRVGYMSVSIEQLTKHTELRDDLQTNINNNNQTASFCNWCR